MRKRIFGMIGLGLLGIFTISSCNIFSNNGGNNSNNQSEATTVTYTVTFDSKGGSNIDSQSIKKGNKATKPTDPTRNGYTFAGWYKEEAYTNQFNFDTTTITSDRTLYAKWTQNSSGGEPTTQYTVTFNANGHGTTPTAQTIASGGKVTRPSDPSASGFSFGGWYKEAACTNSWNFTSDTVSGNLTLYAKWTQTTTDDVITNYAAYTEGAYVTFKASSASAANNSIVSYSSNNTTWTNINSNLIRYDSSTKTARADILGLNAGNYTIKVNNTEKTSTTPTISVTADDTSGYGHFDSSTSNKKISTGIGAYNNDGTLKSNANVIYVTNDNKNTIIYNGNTGLVNILKAQTTSSTPLCVRIIGRISTNQFNYKSDAPRLADNSNLKSDFFTNTLETTYGDNLIGLTIRTTDKKEGTSKFYYTTANSFEFSRSSGSTPDTKTYSRDEYPEINISYTSFDYT